MIGILVIDVDTIENNGHMYKIFSKRRIELSVQSVLVVLEMQSKAAFQALSCENLSTEIKLEERLLPCGVAY